jgi:hypothetical protein
MMAPVSIVLGISYLGALAAVFITCGTLGACLAMTRSRSVQDCIDRAAARRARARRDTRRDYALERASGLRQTQYIALRQLVTDIERWDAHEAERLELEELLDYFVELSVSHQRCLDSLRASGTPTPAMPAALEGPRRTRCADIRARRIRQHDACEAQLDQVADELDAVDELIRLLAQRVASGMLAPMLDGTIERRLAESDEVDAAMTQLSA